MMTEESPPRWLSWRANQVSAGSVKEPVYRALESHALEHLFEKLQKMGVRRVEI
jgi:hypothetical protein